MATQHFLDVGEYIRAGKPDEERGKLAKTQEHTISE